MRVQELVQRSPLARLVKSGIGDLGGKQADEQNGAASGHAFLPVQNYGAGIIFTQTGIDTLTSFSVGLRSPVCRSMRKTTTLSEP